MVGTVDEVFGADVPTTAPVLETALDGERRRLSIAAQLGGVPSRSRECEGKGVKTSSGPKRLRYLRTDGTIVAEFPNTSPASARARA